MPIGFWPVGCHCAGLYALALEVCRTPVCTVCTVHGLASDHALCVSHCSCNSSKTRHCNLAAMQPHGGTRMRTSTASQRNWPWPLLTNNICVAGRCRPPDYQTYVHAPGVHHSGRLRMTAGSVCLAWLASCLMHVPGGMQLQGCRFMMQYKLPIGLCRKALLD